MLCLSHRDTHAIGGQKGNKRHGDALYHGIASREYQSLDLIPAYDDCATQCEKLADKALDAISVNGFDCCDWYLVVRIEVSLSHGLLLKCLYHPPLEPKDKIMSQL